MSKRCARTRLPLAPVALLALLLLTVAPAHGATLFINNVDPPDIGFNDPTPVDPVAGNPGTTIGEQRLIVFQFAADLWGAVLDSDVEIVVQGTFSPLACSENSGVLGAAGTIQIFAAFPGAQWPNTWHHSALANKLEGEDLSSGPPDPGLLEPPFNDDIVAFFNGDIGVNPDCLTGFNWYYGLDNGPGAQEFDLLNVLMHEFAHGLGFANFVDENSGAGPLGLPDIYSAFTRDTATGRHWNQMNNRQRRASAVNSGHVVWDGPNVTAQASSSLDKRSEMTVNDPASIAGAYPVQPAAYGPPLTLDGVTGDVVLVDDGVDTATDGCEFPLQNAAEVAGNIALVDRGACPFALKTLAAQFSGAIGVIVANNQPAGLPPMGGADDPIFTIPSVGISRDDGDVLKSELPSVNVTLGLDPLLLAGADDEGLVLLYAPDPVAPGSSISHWDLTATPNLLMEPSINADLQAATELDLTPALFADLGWVEGPHCPVGSDESDTVVLADCDTKVENAFGPFVVFPNPLGSRNAGRANGGCTLADVLHACEGDARNHGDLVSCTAHVADQLKKAGLITGAEQGRIVTCAAEQATDDSRSRTGQRGRRDGSSSISADRRRPEASPSGRSR